MMYINTDIGFISFDQIRSIWVEECNDSFIVWCLVKKNDSISSPPIIALSHCDELMQLFISEDYNLATNYVSNLIRDYSESCNAERLSCMKENMKNENTN